MKKRLLAMLLAMLMVMGTLPMAAFADEPEQAGSTPETTATVTAIANEGAVAEKDGAKVVLANYNLSVPEPTAPWDDVSLTIDSVTPADANKPKTVKLTLSVTNLKEHKNASNADGKWIGIGVPFAVVGTDTKNYEDGSAYYWGLGPRPSDYLTKGYGNSTTPGYIAGGWSTSQQVTVDGDKYISRYWNLAALTADDESKGYIVAKDPNIISGVITGWTYTIYEVTFKVLLGNAGVVAGGVSGSTKTDADGVHKYTAPDSVTLNLTKSGSDQFSSLNSNSFGYFPKVTMPVIPTGSYVILSRAGNNSKAALDGAMAAAKDPTDSSKPVNYYSETTHNLTTWMEVYTKAQWDAVNDPYWPEISRQPVVDVTVATPVGEGYTYEKYEFDFSATKLALPFELDTVMDTDLTGFGKVANFQKNVATETTEVSATIADRKIAVTGTSKWVDCPAFGTDRTAANYVALKLKPLASLTGLKLHKIEVTMSDGTTKKTLTNPAADALLWQFNEEGTNKEISIRVYFGDNANSGSVAYILDCSGMTLKNAEEAVVPTVVPAPIADHGTPAKPADELGTVAVSTPVAVAGGANTYSLTLTGTNIVKHKNANQAEGYWVGFGMPVEDGSFCTYTSVGTGANGDDEDLKAVSKRTCTVDGKTYNTVYFDTEGVYTIKQYDVLEKTTVTYKVKVVINKKATAYDENTLKPANLTATADGTAPKYGHVQDYDVTNKGNTITIKAHGLEKTTAAADAGKAYWFGVALPKVDDRTYAKGFGEMPATVADSAYKTLTTEQTVEDATYVTTYWGVGSPAGIGNRKTGWLSVKDADGAVINYVVNFDITVADGNVYTAANAPVPANLTGWTADPYKPAGAHATEYKVDQASNTITITAKGLEKTINANGTEAYWVGVALPKQVGCTYATGFGELPAKNAKDEAGEYLVKYEALTTEQTVGTNNYVTTYWGWSAADKFADNSTGWLSVMDDNGRIVDYTVNFVITPAAPTVVAAPIVDHSEAHKTDLGTVTVSPATPVAGKTLTYAVTLTGEDIAYHENANGDEGTWVGFGMPIDNESATGYTYTVNGTDVSTIQERVYTVGTGEAAKHYNTVYFAEEGTYTIEQTKDDITITYDVTVEIKVAEGDTPYDKNTLKPANLTYVEGEDAPAYGHADAYEVTNDGTKITVKAENLKKTANAQEPPVTAYWIGVGVPYAEGAKYAWYFKGTEEPNTAYRTVDRTQDVDGHAYTTLYWGWETVEEMAELKTATLSVMDKDGKITTYDVTFDVTVTGTVSAVPGEDGKVVVDESVIAGLIEAAMNAGNDIVDDAGTSQAPVATIVAANNSDDPDAAPLTEASVDVSVATLKAAQAGEVSVALEVEGVGSITLDPAAIGAIVEDLEDTDKLTLEVAKVNADTLTHTPADIKAEALVSFTASVLDENKEAVPVSGTITLKFKTGLAKKTKNDIEVYQDGTKIPVEDLSGGTLTLIVSHLSEFVITAADEKQDPPTPPDTPSIPNIPSVPSGNTYSVSNGSGSADNGSWSTDKTSAAEGDTVTITVTPAEGYRATVTVKDAQGNKVTVTKAEDGKYTFTMPKSKVDVSVSFAELIVFTDVKDDAYYADAVAWAVANGITNGVGNNKFAPKLGCTRADIVTFLWRAMGSPEVDTTVEFTDVEAGSYYEKAVAWAVANDITNGIGDGKFAPKQVCTRAQIVTFLWRTAKSPEVSDSESGFNDVRADAYYADAVAWAVANEITNGTGNNNFSPKAPCTRADIVTFLYRYMA